MNTAMPQNEDNLPQLAECKSNDESLLRRSSHFGCMQPDYTQQDIAQISSVAEELKNEKTLIDLFFTPLGVIISGLLLGGIFAGAILHLL
jgi:hypothetical protein